MSFVLTSVFDHFLDLVIVLAVLSVLAMGFLATMAGCVFMAVFLARILSRRRRQWPDPRYDAYPVAYPEENDGSLLDEEADKRN